MALLQISEPGQAPDPHQRRLADAIQKSRNIALLPFAGAV